MVDEGRDNKAPNGDCFTIYNPTEDFYYLREDKTGKKGINYETDGEFFGMKDAGGNRIDPSRVSAG
ncbi:MAG: hypothetical protein QW379_03945 [Thermoplasmata archaeon]